MAAMKFVSRSGWHARAPTGVTALPRPDELVFHYSGMNADEQADHKNCAARVRGVQNYHMDSNGWCDIAYNFLVCKHGYIYQGRGWYTRSAAQGTNSGNDGYIAVCFLGDDTAARDDVTSAGRAAFKRVFARYKVWYGKSPILRPHSFFSSTSCPGDQLRAWLKSL